MFWCYFEFKEVYVFNFLVIRIDKSNVFVRKGFRKNLKESDNVYWVNKSCVLKLNL